MAPSRTATLSSIGCQTASVRSATTATRSLPLSDVATTADSVVRSSAAAAATRRSLGNSWATQVGGAPTVTQLRITEQLKYSKSTCFSPFLLRPAYNCVRIRTAIFNSNFPNDKCTGNIRFFAQHSAFCNAMHAHVLIRCLGELFCLEKVTELMAQERPIHVLVINFMLSKKVIKMNNIFLYA